MFSDFSDFFRRFQTNLILYCNDHIVAVVVVVVVCGFCYDAFKQV